MSKPLGIIELIQHVGEENVQCQSIHQSFVAADKKKNESTITFATDHMKAQDIMRHVATNSELEWVGMVVWMPKAKLPPS